MKRELCLMTFWAINDQLDLEKMKSQLDNMRDMGFDGTIFQPRNFPNLPEYLSEEYMEILSQVILYAKKIGLSFWIYDENGWPSGTADGRVLEKFPDSTCEWIQMTKKGIKYFSKNAVNTFHKEAMEYFVHITYDEYRLGLSPEAFDYVTGFFSDEVGFLDGHGASVSKGGIPWSKEVDIRYKKQYGEGVEDKLELLFVEKDGYEVVRYRYWQILTDLLADTFYATINSWCQRYNKKYTAHLKGEENPFFQVPYSGSPYQNLQRVNIPAVDALERHPSNNYFPRIASSIAKQFYNGDSLVEAIGGSGWGLSPKDFEDYVTWLMESGINLYTFHLSQYTLNSNAIRDWPPSIPFDLNWKDCIKPLLTRLRVKWDTLSQENNTLIIAPTRGVMAKFNPIDSMVINEHNGDGVPNTKSGILSTNFVALVENCYNLGLDYDVTEERIIEEHGEITAKGLGIGNVRYTSVIVGEGCVWEKDEIPKLLEKYGLVAQIENVKVAETTQGQEKEDEKAESKELVWEFVKSGENQVFIEWQQNQDKLNFTIPVEIKSKLKNMGLLLMDKVKRVLVNGIELEGFEEKGGYYYIFSESILNDIYDKGIVDISVTTLINGEKQPFAFLQGVFLVKNTGSSEETDNHQVMVDGSFYITDRTSKIDCTNLLISGYPFMKNPIRVRTKVELKEAQDIILSEIHADAARVYINGKDYGFIWGSEWTIDNVEKGNHIIELELIPSTYNTFGPHHHIDGDRHLISPAQYSGEKNFADWPSSPDNTLISKWHFVKFGIK